MYSYLEPSNLLLITKQHRCRPWVEWTSRKDMDYQKIKHFLARWPENASRSAPKRANTKFWLQCECDFSLWEHIVRSHPTTCADTRRPIGSKPLCTPTPYLCQPARRRLTWFLQIAGASERPIIFVCHSLGGIIVKRVGYPAEFPVRCWLQQALAYSASRTGRGIEHLHSIYVSTFAVLFLGTPHGGSGKARLAARFRRVLDTLAPSKVWDTNGQLLEALREGSEILQNITDQFVPIMKQFRIYFFWEQEKTDMKTTKDYVSCKISHLF